MGFFLETQYSDPVVQFEFSNQFSKKRTLQSDRFARRWTEPTILE